MTTQRVREKSENSQMTSPTSSFPIYLDHHSTTPVDPRVALVVVRAMTEVFGNANSIDHVFGEAAAQLVTASAESVAALVGADREDVRFTSGSTEAIRLALAHSVASSRGKRLRVAVSRVEHNAVLNAVSTAVRSGAAAVTWIDVDSQARLVQGSLDSALGRGVDMVCLMAANNEVGTVYPVEEVAARVHAHGAAIFVDATQAAGRQPLCVRDWQIDYLVLSGHKIYGPKGIGALIAPGKHSEIAKLDNGGEGTPNVPGIAGFGEACRLRVLEMMEDEPRIAALRDRLEAALRRLVPELIVNGDREHRLSNNLHISAPGVPNDAIVGRLRRSVAISTGAACTSGAHTPSHVLQAMGLSDELQEGALRIGVGKFNTLEDIDRAASEIASAIDTIRIAVKREIQS
jgi:cysteine desulfurase